MRSPEEGGDWGTALWPSRQFQIQYALKLAWTQ